MSETLATLLSELSARDVRLWMEGDRLRLSAPKDALSADLHAQLSERRSEIVAFLRSSGQGPRRVPRPQGGPLSYAQERLWFLQKFDPESVAYNLQTSVELEGPWQEEVLRVALRELVERHEVLRTRFEERAEGPLQVVEPPGDPAVVVTDLRQLPAAEREAAALACAHRDLREPFDLGGAPARRFQALVLDAARARLLVTQHHILTDGWSIALLVEEIVALHAAAAGGRKATLPEPLVQYGDFAVWERRWLSGEVLEQRRSFWREALRGAPLILDLPTDRPRGPVATSRGGLLRLGLSEDLARRVAELARAERATPFMVYLAAFQALLGRQAGQEEVVVGTAQGTRSQIETERTLGLFVNTLALRGDLTGDPSFRALVARTRRAALGAFTHGDFPFEKLVEELKPPRDLARPPVVQALFVLQNTPLEDIARASDGSPSRVGESGGAAYELSLTLVETGRGVRAAFEYNADLFDERTVRGLFERFERLLEAATLDADRRLSSLSGPGTEERRQLARWNATTRAWPEQTADQMFFARAAAEPNRLAASGRGVSCTYGELAQRARAYAAWLRELGACEGRVVALYMERSPDLLAALLGTLHCGAAYLPLDPAHPPERLSVMFDDARPVVMVADQDLPTGFAAGCPVLDPRVPARPTPKAGNGDGPTAHRPGSLAYVIFTSGSTGKPKGVEIEHRSLANLLCSMRESPGFGASDVLLAVTTFSFDIAALELLLPLVAGGRVVLASREQAADPAELAALIGEARATVMQATPATWRMLVDSGWPGRRGLRMLCGGEALPLDLARELVARGETWNVYGPTETTIWSTLEKVEGDGALVTVGRPLANTTAHILDPRGEPCPIGAIGELCLGGEGVARGYRGRPDTTADRFVPDPWAETAGARLYRTGDLGRFRADGRIECFGRADHQIKLRGHRIEPGEIEAALRARAEVRDAVVVARGEGAARRLVAYLVAGGELPDAASLRAQLRERLPEIMVPAQIVRLAALPRTPNGKIDRRALPEPPSPEAFGRPIAARTPVEEAVVAILAEVLGLSQVGIYDDFFELGGHSLTAARALGRVKDVLGVALPLRRLFETPHAAGLAQALEEARGSTRVEPGGAVLVARGDGPPALSFAQERLWFLHHLDEGSAAYHIPLALRLRGELDEEALERALRAIWRRHEGLRLAIDTVDGLPVPRTRSAEAAPLVRDDLSGLAPEEAQAGAEAACAEEARRPFDLARDPLFRARLLRLGPSDHLLLVTLHHLVADAWSLGILTDELTRCYGAFHRGGEPTLPPLPLRYTDYVAWQRELLQGPATESQLSYWRRQLLGVPPLVLPTDRPRPTVQTFAGAHAHFVVEPRVVDGLRRLGREEKATLFMVLLAGFSGLLARYAGQEDLAVGTPVAGRGRPELEQVVGLFVNTLVLRARLDGDPTVREAVRRWRETALEAFAHADTPFERLVEELRPPRDLAASPLFQVMFVLQNAPTGTLDLPGLALRPFGLDPGTSRFDLTVFATETPHGLYVTAEYNTDLFDRSRMERFSRHFGNLLRAMAECAPDARLFALPLLDEDERATLVETWNATERPVDERPVPRQFALQAQARPEAPAVGFEGETWTYGQLLERSNRIANRLLAQDLGPEPVVAIALERSLDLVAALLGTLRAGGVYLPLDLAYPARRLEGMLADARARVVLASADTAARLPASGAVVLSLPEILASSAGGQEPLAPDPHPDQLAYLLYTSGSTGTPKGVGVPHGALSRFLAAMAEAPGLDAAEVLLSVTTLSFDIAALELYLPLVRGARVELASRETAQDGRRLLEALRRVGANVLQATPATWRLLLEAGFAGEDLRVWCGGEALGGELAQALLRAPEVWNLYGPTETTVWSTAHRVERAEAIAPLGRPIANTRVYVLDSRGEPVPIGVPGELFIGGGGVARGYRFRPDLTAERFVPDAFATDPGGRLYRTGDLCRWREDGVLEFLGRVDQQVKVRGFRIEIGEVEAALSGLPSVGQAVATTRTAGGEAQLVAFVVLRPDAEATVSELRAGLKERLPAYMVPSSIVLLDALPLTPNGKVDRRALRALQDDGGEPRPRVLPRTPMERLVAEAWHEALGHDRLSVHDNFFDVGGHSLLAMRVLARIEALVGQRLNPRELIFQTLEQFAALLERAAPAPAVARPLRGPGARPTPDPALGAAERVVS